MKKLALIICLCFVLPIHASGARWFKATALDTEGYESDFSNVVVLAEFVNSFTLAWTPNSEPDIMGYRIWVNCADEYGYMPIPIDINHLDYCLETECQITLDLNNPTIEIKGGVP